MKGLLHRIMLFFLLYLFIVSCNNDCTDSIQRIKILRNKYTLEFCDTFNLETRVYSAMYKGTFISYLYETGEIYIDIVAGNITTDDEWGLDYDLTKGEEQIKEEVERFHLNEFIYLKTFNFNKRFRTLAYVFHNTKGKKIDHYFFISTCKFDGHTMQIRLSSNVDKYSFRELDMTNRFFLKNIKIYKNG